MKNDHKHKEEYHLYNSSVSLCVGKLNVRCAYYQMKNLDPNTQSDCNTYQITTLYGPFNEINFCQLKLVWETVKWIIIQLKMIIEYFYLPGGNLYIQFLFPPNRLDFKQCIIKNKASTYLVLSRYWYGVNFF